MKRIIFVLVGAFLIIGPTLVWLENYRNAPAVTAQSLDFAASGPNRDASEIQNLLPGQDTSQKISTPILSDLGGSDRYALEMNNILPGREAAKIVVATNLSVLDATDRYTLERHHVLPGQENNNDVLSIREATRAYKWSEAAVDAGFIQLFDCIEHQVDPSIGAMGVHFIEPTRFDDQLVLEEPEVLVYEQKSDGRMKLVAVEYIILAAAWNENTPPVFLGQELKYKTSMGQYGQADGIDPYYEVHVWAWKHNPSGLFADWNPKVSCPAQ